MAKNDAECFQVSSVTFQAWLSKRCRRNDHHHHCQHELRHYAENDDGDDNGGDDDKDDDDDNGGDDDNGDDDVKDDGCHVHHILGRKAHRHPTHVQLMAQKADNGFAPRSNVQCSYEQCTYVCFVLIP